MLKQTTETALKKEMVALETRYWNAIKAQDAQTAVSLSGEPCIVVGPQGVGEFTRAALTRMMDKEQPCRLNRFSLDEVHMTQLSDDVVALAYTVNEDFTMPDGKLLKFKAFDSSVWKKDADEGWICVLHTETPEGDVFGDRKPG